MKYYWDGSAWVERKPSPQPKGPYVWGDLPPYKSPLGTGIIDGRRARREDMARADCREVDPSERLPINPKTEKDVAREQAYLNERAANPYSISEQTRERLLRNG